MFVVCDRGIWYAWYLVCVVFGMRGIWYAWYMVVVFGMRGMCSWYLVVVCGCGMWSWYVVVVCVFVVCVSGMCSWYVVCVVCVYGVTSAGVVCGLCVVFGLSYVCVRAHVPCVCCLCVSMRICFCFCCLPRRLPRVIIFRINNNTMTGLRFSYRIVQVAWFL